MSNFLSPPDYGHDRLAYPDNLYLNATREDLIALGLEVVETHDHFAGEPRLNIFLDTNPIPLVIRVAEDETLYAVNERDLTFLNSLLGIIG